MHELITRETLQHLPPARRPRLGIIGGGQLARMTALAAAQLGCDTAILERSLDCPAVPLATEAVSADWSDPRVLCDFARQCDALTLENEFVPVDALAAVESAGHRLYPRAATMRLVQDKFRQKQVLAGAGLPVAPFARVEHPEDIARFAAESSWPVVLKAREGGYDGKGNATVRSAAEAVPAWQQLNGASRALYVEAWCPFERELAVIVTRGADGATVTYPVVETIQREHICRIVRAPADVPAAVAHQAAAIAGRAIEAVDGVGSWGVELFVLGDGAIWINELAPRVHNSGHYSIEGCLCSQFENHVRAILGWPLGASSLSNPAAVMVNLIAENEGPGHPAGVHQALAVPGAHLHLYGKSVARAGRKMGHVTALGSTVAEAETIAQRAADHIRFGNSGQP